MSKYILGVDNGLTGIKAVVFNSEGREIVSHGCNTPLENLGGGIVEMNPQRLWDDTAAVMRETILKSGIDLEKIIAVANSAHGNGLYAVDRQGNPLSAAILPMDLRSEDIVHQWEKESKKEEIFEYTLQKAWPGQPAPILRWLKEYRPTLYSEIGQILFCKDWLKYKLTGKYTTDYSDASAAGLLDNNQKVYSQRLLELYEIPEIMDKLPPLKKSWDICGTVTKEASEKCGLKEGTPVAAGMFDVNACCIGTGVYEPGTYSVIAGTWGINSILSNQKVKSKNIVQCTIFADGEQYLCIDSSATSSVNLEWFMKNSVNIEKGIDYEWMEEVVGGFSPTAQIPLFLPFIYPSVHFPKVNAAFLGLKADHTQEDMLRAVFEGIALGHGLQLERLRACGLEGSNVVFTGGASQSEVWCRIFTDVFGVSLETHEAKQSGALGAAMAAGIAVGLFKDIQEASRCMVRKKKIYIPDFKNIQIFQQKMKTMKKVIEILSKNV